MTSLSTICEYIDTSIRKNYIKKGEQNIITAGLNKIRETLNKSQDIKIIDTIIEIINKQKIPSAEKKIVINLHTKLTNIVSKYIEEYEESNNEDNIEIDKTPDEVEEILDNKIQKYNRYTEHHPMKGVTYDRIKKHYRIEINDTRTSTTELNIACKKAIYEINNKIVKTKISRKNSGNHRENPGSSRENPVISEKNIIESDFNTDQKISFFYKNHYFICYEYDNEIFFDIQHIISVLNLKPDYIIDKYTDFKNKIEYYVWSKNKFNGYILRELIREDTAYQIILSSNSNISISFKNDVSKILSKLRKNGELVITNNNIKIDDKRKKILPNIPAVEKIINETNLIPYNYNNQINITYICSLISQTKKFPIHNYIKQHVLYAFLLPIPVKNDDIIIKFGYTENILNRFGQLESEYKCKPIFISCRIISGQSDELTFHDMIKKQYNNLIFKYDSKKELYKFHPQLLTIFNNYKPDLQKNISYSNNRSHETDNIIDYINHQSVEFINNIIELYPESYGTNLLFLTQKYNFELEMKDKDIKLKEKEIEVLKLKLEINKSKLSSNKKSKSTKKKVIKLH